MYISIIVIVFVMNTSSAHSFCKLLDAMGRTGDGFSVEYKITDNVVSIRKTNNMGKLFSFLQEFDYHHYPSMKGNVVLYFIEE